MTYIAKVGPPLLDGGLRAGTDHGGSILSDCDHLKESSEHQYQQSLTLLLWQLTGSMGQMHSSPGPV